jgi:hypothetical protein
MIPMEIPKTMKAVVISPITKPSGEMGRDIVLKDDVPVADLLPGMCRVKAEVVALNGTDWYHPVVFSLSVYR